MPLRLRPLAPDDEPAFVAAHQALAGEGVVFGLGYAPGMAWPAYLRRLEDHRCGRNVTGGLVPSTFLVADVGGTLVGRASVRHVLNPFLERIGGHIGYVVVPEHRRRGYATEILRQSLQVAHTVGIAKALVTCDATNVASRRVIELCGGVPDVTYDGPEVPVPKLRFWIG